MAEESFHTKLKVPKSKGFRGVLCKSVLDAGPCIRSEVVFRYKGKAIGKVGSMPELASKQRQGPWFLIAALSSRCPRHSPCACLSSAAWLC